MSLSPNDKLAAAILKVCEPPVGMAPYFGIMLRGLVRREMPEFPTLAVTKNGILLWGTPYVNRVTVDELAQGLMHEVMHLVLKHHERAEALGVIPDPSPEASTRAALANMAMDACDNEELNKIKPVPADWILPETLGQPPGLVFEERFRLLEQAVKKQQPGEGDKQKPDVGKGWCGSCAGRPAPDEPAAKGQQDAEGRSEADMARLRRATAEAVKDAKDAVAKGRGNVPGSLAVWADKELAPPKIDWRERLRRVVRGAVAFKSGQSDYIFSKISRRQAGVGFGVGRPVVPALHSPVPDVAVLVDVSGSMLGGALEQAAAEVNGVLKAVGAKVLVVTVDASLQGAKECHDINEALALFKGGGGTVLMPGWEAILRKKPCPSVIVCLTDGAIGGPGDGYPAVEPGAKVVWVVVGGSQRPCCPWGDCVIVNEDDAREAV